MSQSEVSWLIVKCNISYFIGVININILCPEIYLPFQFFY